jgi:transposase
VLWKELKDMGYAGQLKSVRRYLHRYHQNHRRSPRQTAWLFMTDPQQLVPDEDADLSLILSRSELLNTVYHLSQTFIQMLSDRDSQDFDQWLQSAERSGVRVFEHFALGLRQDYQAVRAAFDYEWSNGQTEGQVTRLKLIKRQMYGRANFDLLRIRILGPP